MQNNDTPRGKLWKMIRSHRFAMMTTLEDDNHLRSRPMTTIEREYDDTLWFFAKIDSAAVTALKVHPQLCLSYADPGAADFVCVAGSGAVVTDVQPKREYWTSLVQNWFPEGPESAQVVLIKVTPDHAECWDSKSNRLMRLFSKAKALATGTPPDMGEHRDVKLLGTQAPMTSNR